MCALRNSLRRITKDEVRHPIGIIYWYMFDYIYCSCLFISRISPEKSNPSSLHGALSQSSLSVKDMQRWGSSGGKLAEAPEIHQENLRFLNFLKEPCEKLAEATPPEIPAILPELLNYVRCRLSTDCFRLNCQQQRGSP